MIASQWAADRVVRSTVDSATAALQHSRLRIDKTQQDAATAMHNTQAAEAQALQLARRLADIKLQEQRVGYAERAEKEIEAISAEADAKELTAIRTVEAYADELHQGSMLQLAADHRAAVARIEADGERQHRALYDRLHTELQATKAEVSASSAFFDRFHLSLIHI